MNSSTSPTTAERIASRVFGVDGAATPLPGEIDENFKIETANGAYVLKLAPASTDPSHLAARHEAMVALAAADLGYDVARPIAAGNGASIVTLDGGVLARLVTWVPGLPFGAAGRPPELAAGIGRLAGKISRALASFEHPGLHREFDWDLTRAGVVLDRLAQTIAAPSRRAVIASVRRRLATRAEPAFGDLPRQAIHGDLNDLNVMVDGDRVSGFIDFGDLGYSIRIGEAAIAATYAMLGQDDPLAVGRSVIGGFESVVKLEQRELELTFDLILARLAVSACMAAHRRDQANPHLTVSEADVWDLLERLDAADHDKVAAELVDRPPPEARVTLLERRKRWVGPSLSLSYESSPEGPLAIARGAGAYLYDDRGRRYLDCVNNVAHVGHGHPAVIDAATRQMAVLNTNTRYLHDTILSYAERLAGTLPDGIDVVYFTNSGSEANELAVRMARAATGRHDIAVVEHGYHGNTSTLVDISPYKFEGPGGSGRPDWVHVLPNPDPYRTPYTGAGAATAYATAAADTLAGVEPAALIVEAIIGCGGQVVPEPGVLGQAYRAARDVGAVVIADEVQTGFGRVGSTFWAFELQGAVPDIVTMGKPIGNGHPLGAVATTRRVAGAFANGMEYFNTFGGNPVSAAVGLAVLDVLDREELQENARRVGGWLVEELRGLASRHAGIGDVRGHGFFIGIELVRDRAGKEPAAALTKAVVEEARRHGVLLSIDGPHRNVIKIKPPMVFSTADAEKLATTLDSALRSIGAPRADTSAS